MLGEIAAPAFAFSVIMGIWIAIYFGVHAVWNYRQAEIDQWKLQARAEAARPDALKLQLNPHFFFNCLSSVRALISEAPGRAKKMVARLARLLRRTLQAGDEKTVPLREELSRTETYLQLENVRFEDRLDWETNASEAAPGRQSRSCWCRLSWRTPSSTGSGSAGAAGPSGLRRTRRRKMHFVCKSPTRASSTTTARPTGAAPGWQTPASGFSFVTAYDEYAIRAFEVNALDYLVKPVEEERLAEALETVQEQAALSEEAAAGPAPQPEPDESEAPDELTAEDKVFVKDGRRCWFVRLSEVRLFEAAGNYTKLHFDGEEPLIHRSLSDLEERFDPDRFFRASRQHILNLDWVEDMNSRPNGKLVAHLAGGTNVELSHRRSRTFRKELGLYL